MFVMFPGFNLLYLNANTLCIYMYVLVLMGIFIDCTEKKL